MIKKKYLLLFASLIIVVALYSFLSNNRKTDSLANEIAVEKVMTKVDSLIFRYDSLLSQKIDSSTIVGAAVVITYKGEIAHIKCYGVKEAGGEDSIDIHTAFRLASVSKTVTGVLSGILSDEKLVCLDDKVIDYLPGFKLKDSINTTDLSIRHILSHTSGLVPHAYDNLVEAQIPFNIIMDSLQLVNISAVPGELYGYQNVVFSLYDTIASAKTSKSYEELLQEKVFTPFGMSDASASFSSFAGNNNIALPHRGQKTLALNNRYYNTIPAAGINASISDMGQFLIALSGHDSTVLSSDITEKVLTPQVISPLRRVYLRKWSDVESKHYALGWRIIGYQGHHVAYHGGYVQGYRAEIAYCRDEDFGIAYLTNSPGGVGSGVVPELLDMWEW